MKRHKWIKGVKELKNMFTEQEQCESCKIYRFKALGSWMYSREKTTDKNPFVDRISNPGCNN